MNKLRVESFTDGVFAIVMTLLVFNLHIPVITGPINDVVLWHQIALILPSIVIYVMSFIVLSSLWMNHHFLFNSFTETLNRQLTLFNLTYLLFVVFIPFSASFVGMYSAYRPADILYGVNIFLVALTSALMANYIRNSPEIENEHLSRRTMKQARFRSILGLSSYLIGIVFAFIYIPVSIFFYLLPVIFNIIPGSLDLAEKIFRFKLD